jgi:5-methyltetrahydropteroyltriglutamate--homocysteine methyltransferase
VAATRPPFRAEHIGSLLRPAKLLRERARVAKGEINAAELAAAEDDAIIDAIRLQERLGFKFVTDGEFRRRSYHSFFYGALGQLRIDTIGGADAVGADEQGGRGAQPVAIIGSRVQWTHPINACDASLLKNPLGSLAEDHDSGALRAALPRRRRRRNGKRVPGCGSILVGYD